MEDNSTQFNSGITPNNDPNQYRYYRPKAKKKKFRWWIPLSIIAAIILIIVAIIASIGAFLGSIFENEPMEVKSNSVLYLDLSGAMNEYQTLNPMQLFSGNKSASFMEILNAVEKAKTDDRIKGIYIRSGSSGMGFAKIEELNDEINSFKKSGKFVYSYFDVGGERDYMLALPAQKICMPLEGMIELNGFGNASMFYTNFLNKIGVNFFVCGFEDFKSAADAYSRTSFSDSSRLQLKVYMQQMSDLLISGISKFRNIPSRTVDSLISEGIYTTSSMLGNGLIDEVATESQVKNEMSKLAWGKEYQDDKKVRLVSVSDYVYSEPYKHSKNLREDDERQIAVIYASGEIYNGASTQLFSQNQSIYSDEFVRNLQKAVRDDDVKAIILRIDSPGGSVLGSEIIWQEIKNAEKVKPVYASMSDIAASGGYYMAMACDTIIAHPATLTGSIGVISAIPNYAGTLAKLSITVDTIKTHKNALFLNPALPVTDEMKQHFTAMSREIYFRFISRVAESRKMSFDKTRSLAKGRVWTGLDAKKRGLVDIFGDLRTAISIAKRRIGLI